jgi:L,D-transpeptidase YcbB
MSTPTTRSDQRRPIRRQTAARLSWLAATLLLLSPHSQAYIHPLVNPVSTADQLQAWLTLDTTPDNHPELQQIYRAANYQPLWLQGIAGQPGLQLSDTAVELIQILDETAADGWQKYPFRLAAIHNLLTTYKSTTDSQNRPGIRQNAELELELTNAALAYGQMVLENRLLPDIQETDQGIAVQASMAKHMPVEHFLQAFLQAASRHQPAPLLQQLTPQSAAYKALRAEFNRYRNLAASGHWQTLPSGLILKPGDSDEHIPALRQRLQQYGDLGSPDPTINPVLFDDSLRLALQQFQSRHNLPASGQLDRNTLQALNEPPEYIARKIALNMKRQRFMPDIPDERYILVNAADFRLHLYEQGRETLDMKVIVGQPAHRTPIMVHAITQLELAPTWSVPNRIAIEDLLPRFRKDADHVSQNNYRISLKTDPGTALDPATINWNDVSTSKFPYRIVQSPGVHNALGKVKFLFPNQQSIYLHDTSQPSLFRKSSRALSSGCVRLEKPMELTEYLLAGQTSWDMERVQQTIRNHQQTRLNLLRPVPLYLMYWTAWVDEQGHLQLRDDVYKRDKAAGITLTGLQASR